VIAASHFRRGGADGREPLAAPEEILSIAKNYTPSQQYWGKFTSRPPRRLSKADIALTAFRLGVKPAALRRAIELGMI
jgi:hypothetical protein